MAKPHEAEAFAAAKWWQGLQPNSTEGFPGDRAALARLRRVSSVLEAASEPATIALYGKLGFRRSDAARDLPRAALVAAVLAQVREDGRRYRFAEAMGRPRGGNDSEALVSSIRFKRLVAAREPDELLIAFRRAVAILGKTAGVKDLARQLLAFTDPDAQRADVARTLFAFDYHGAAEAAPQSEPTAEVLSSV